MSFFLGHSGASLLSGRSVILGGLLREIQVILVISARKLDLPLWFYRHVLRGFMKDMPHPFGSQVYIVMQLSDSVHWSTGKKALGITSRASVYDCAGCTLHSSRATIHI